LKLQDHDEYLHLGYPRENLSPWKENYYFNFIDTTANCLGIFHVSIQRHKGTAILKAICVLDGNSFSYINEIEWPLYAGKNLSDSVVISDGVLTFEILEPFKRHRVLFDDSSTRMNLIYEKRFDQYLYSNEGFTDNHGDKALDVVHYEQGMSVNGDISIGSTITKISCLGHRDHTWGFRDEQNLGGWNWIAIQCDNSTWNFYQLRRNNGSPNSVAGFISYKDRNETIIDVQVIDIQNNVDGEPVFCDYRVKLESGTVFNISAERFIRMPIPFGGGVPVIHHENFSNFLIKETGEKGVGIDEHMIVST
jgi:hypothetical protein